MKTILQKISKLLVSGEVKQLTLREEAYLKYGHFFIGKY